MTYKKWIFDRNEILNLWIKSDSEYPIEIKEIEDILYKDKIAEIYRFVKINFSDDEINEGIKVKLLKFGLHKYAENVFFNEANGIDDLIVYFSKIKLFDLFNKDVSEPHIKSLKGDIKENGI